MQYILILLIFLCGNLSYAGSIDSMELEFNSPHEVDSIVISQNHFVDFDYIFLDSTKSENIDPIQDSILNLIEIEYTDLTAWFAKMDKLKRNKTAFPTVDKQNRPTWMLSVLFILLIGLGLVRIFFYSTFLNIIYGFFNERVLAQISKEDNVLTSWPYIFLYIIFSCSLGLFVLIYFSIKQDVALLTINNFGRLSLFLGVLFVAKLLLIRIISVIFETERIARNYITVLYLVYFNSMLFLVPLLVLAVFIPYSYLDFLMILFIVGTILLFSYRMIRTAIGLLGNLKFSMFYLILYLCALEIAPILILVKSLNN